MIKKEEFSLRKEEFSQKQIAFSRKLKKKMKEMQNPKKIWEFALIPYQKVNEFLYFSLITKMRVQGYI